MHTHRHTTDTTPRMRLLTPYILPALLGILLTACDDNTAMIGMDIMPGKDKTDVISQTFPVQTSTVETGAMLANTSTCYLGSVIDPELGIRTTSDFLAQFHVPYYFSLPETIVRDDDNRPVADSCDIRVYFDSYYGDSLATLKIRVRELDKNNVMEEDVKYYTDINPHIYVSPNPEVDKSLTYAVKDLSRPDDETSGITYYRQVAVKLPKEYADKMVQHFFDHKEHFANSYEFIHNVCPGFYFELTGGTGSMLTTKMMAMNLYFRYHTTTDEGNDTIVDGMQRMGATEEVIQNTSITNEIPTGLDIATTPYTLAKTPAAYCTEVSLPVLDIIKDEHYNDSVLQAKLSLRRYPKDEELTYPMPQASNLLLIRKDSLLQSTDATTPLWRDFFEKNKLPDSRNAYLVTYSSTASVYQFANIAALITQLKNELNKAAGVTPEDDAAERLRKYDEWISQPGHEDWNKVLLMPVNAEYTSSSSIYGQTTSTLRSVRPELGLTSTKLEGGAGQPLTLEVLYGRSNK